MMCPQILDCRTLLFLRLGGLRLRSAVTHAARFVEEVVFVSTATTVGEGLALFRGRVISPASQEGATRPNLRLQRTYPYTKTNYTYCFIMMPFALAYFY